MKRGHGSPSPIQVLPEVSHPPFLLSNVAVDRRQRMSATPGQCSRPPCRRSGLALLKLATRALPRDAKVSIIGDQFEELFGAGGDARPVRR